MRRLSPILACALTLAAACTPQRSADDRDEPLVPEPGADAGRGARDAGNGPATDGGDTVPNELELTKGGSRIRTRIGRTPDGAQSFMGWWDAHRGAPCMFMRGADGRTRCLTGQPMSTGYFADAACTQRVAIVASCETITEGIIHEPSGDGCGAVVPRVFAVTGTHSGPLYVKASTCVSTTGPVGYRAVRLGAEIPPAEFVEMTETIE